MSIKRFIQANEVQMKMRPDCEEAIWCKIAKSKSTLTSLELR